MIGRIKEQFKRAFGPVGRALGRTGVPPNLLTIFGPIIAVFAALFLNGLIYSMIVFGVFVSRSRMHG